MCEHSALENQPEQSKADNDQTLKCILIQFEWLNRNTLRERVKETDRQREEASCPSETLLEISQETGRFLKNIPAPFGLVNYLVTVSWFFFFLKKGSGDHSRRCRFFLPLSPSQSSQLLLPGNLSTQTPTWQPRLLQRGLITHYEIPSTQAPVCGFVIRAVIFPWIFTPP